MTTMRSLLIGLTLVPILALAQKPQVPIGPGKGSGNFRVPFHQTGTRLLHKDTVYVLTGWYFVDSLASLTIQPGTVVYGDSGSGGSLIISRGGKINAAGTSTSPIIFTSAKPVGQRRPGDWGGIIVLGSAPTNKPSSQQIEGGFGTIASSTAAYGGSNPDDSSGVLQYVRIEFAGIAYAQDNEVNGLTFGGVGRKTLVDHIQVSYANDDDFEFFGGTVDAKYLVSWRSLDDTYDTDYGYAGRLQFLFAKRDPNIFDASASGSSNGFESDNEASTPFAATPRTSVRISNATIVGPAADSAAANALNSKWQYVAMLRRSTELSIYNSVLTGYRLGINIRDTLTQVAAQNGNLEVRNTSLAANREMVRTSSSPTTGVPAGFNAITWFTTAAYANNGSTARQGTDLLPAAAWNLDATLNPVPTTTSEAATAGTAFNVGRLNGDSWFTNVPYRGAFDPTKPMSQQWTAGWTNFDPQNAVYGLTTSVERDFVSAPVSYDLEQNYPNPFNPSTEIRFTLPTQSRVRLTVLNVLGQELASLVDGELSGGQHSVTFDASRFTSGVYFYRLEAGGIPLVRKMTLLK